MNDKELSSSHDKDESYKGGKSKVQVGSRHPSEGAARINLISHTNQPEPSAHHPLTPSILFHLHYIVRYHGQTNTGLTTEIYFIMKVRSNV